MLTREIPAQLRLAHDRHKALGRDFMGQQPIAVLRERGESPTPRATVMKALKPIARARGA